MRGYYGVSCHCPSTWHVHNFSMYSSSLVPTPENMGLVSTVYASISVNESNYRVDIKALEV